LAYDHLHNDRRFTKTFFPFIKPHVLLWKLFMLTRKVRPSVRRCAQNKPARNRNVRRFLVPNFTQIQKSMWTLSKQ
jgi:hypothetical protein